MATTTTRISPFLRRVLLADAAASGLTGLMMALGADAPLAGLLGVPAALLRYAGLALLPFAGFVLWLATREAAVPRLAVWVVILGNALWAVDSLALLLSGWIAPTALGIGFVAAQALAVAVLAELQYVGLRRSQPAA